MARPSQDAIDTFISFTGSTEAAAIQKLEENRGDLNAAVNAYFSEGDRRNLPADDDDLMNIDNHVNDETPQPTFPLLSAARGVNPFSVLDPNFGRNFFDRATDFPGLSPIVSHPREVREIPIEFKNENNDSSSSAHGPVIEDVTGTVSIPGSETHGTVIIDDDEDEDIPNASADHRTSHNEIHNAPGDVPLGTHPRPGATPSVDLIDYNNDIEEEMIQAAIEASKHDAGGYPSQHSDAPNQPSVSHFERRSPPFEDSDLARAVSLSLKTAEQERALREQAGQANEAQPSYASDIKQEEVHGTTLANGSHVNSVEENVFVHEEDEEEEQPLVRHRSRRLGTGNAGTGQVIDSSSSSPEQHDVSVHPQNNGDAFQSDEWGGISNEEHDEAVMLEAAMFGGVPDNTAYHFPYPSHQGLQNSSSFYPRVPRPPSPTLVEQRLLREQQDDEYLAALRADREKELKFMQEAERRQLEEAAAREASLERERHQEEENRKKLLEEEEFKRELAAKEASLPQEPGPDDESAVTLLVRMPDGSRQGRRFSKSDRLQFLFDFIDIGRLVKPGTYRLVRPFPRRAFTVGESELTLSELGLTSKQEALFLELV
ncbi:Ubiquitin-like protein [Dioscorea alata]|uniref:Ubiquitin-like protein n=1 Tax=Dioscorea alata TaxID=55571 RepID=A0ACB7WVB1_DIOAL|nr:Ubiquitin-like protein [Dioscorea alata]